MTDVVWIDDIVVVDRHRQDLGDIAGLAASIAAVGLLNPVTITVDGRLIAGHRRLEACRLLGHDTIRVCEAESVIDAAAELAAERDENTCRKEMTPSERVALGRALEELERPKAKERMSAGGRGGVEDPRSVPANGPSRYDTREVVAPAVGMSTATYSRAKQLVDAAEDETLPVEQRDAAREAVAEMDATGKVTPAYEKYKGEPVNRGAAAPVRRTSPDVVPASSDKSREAVVARSRAIADLAASNHSSRQIATKTGIALTTVKSIAKRDGIDIPADAVMGGTQGQVIDPTRVTRETVYALEGLATGVGYIADVLDRIDLTEAVAQEWATSLNDSLRALNRFSKQIKEMTHVHEEA